MMRGLRAACVIGAVMLPLPSVAVRSSAHVAVKHHEASAAAEAAETEVSIPKKLVTELGQLQDKLQVLKAYGGDEVKALEKKIKKVKKAIKKARKAAKLKLEAKWERQAEEVAAWQEKQEALQRALAERHATLMRSLQRDDSGREVSVQVVEVEAQDERAIAAEDLPTPEESVTTDPCCDGGVEGRVADDATPEGTYTITVKHSGLSLSDSGVPGSCQQTSLPIVSVQYLCPQQCTPEPRFLQDWLRIFASRDDVSEADIDECSLDNCKGWCFNPHDTEWKVGKVVNVEAERLRECSVVGGWRYDGNTEPKVVMTSSCRERFEVARQLLFSKTSD
eukprot:TRINITY_DN10427_c0_g1_i1.p1 TRINITY_DN10427_c0_g1~~TRINITY_DN10427_c0_g1_i1.p1  ORF type:complete len:335 (-),score=104.45 TRINITY_DN10427_c0_g1_i1:232-1236(-)